MKQMVVGVTLLVLTAGCNALQSNESVRVVQIQQAWELQPGDTIAGHPVAGSLGDISIQLDGAKVYAPFDGLVQPNNVGECVIFSSPDVPAYLFRLCGMSRPRLGEIKQGRAIGSANYLQFAALRRQPDGKWAMVEPASDILQRTLTQP
ncbi:MAG TPA: hypothetical protein V6C78_10915 [Crinalium sp.]